MKPVSAASRARAPMGARQIWKRLLLSVLLLPFTAGGSYLFRRALAAWGILDPFAARMGLWLKMHVASSVNVSPDQFVWALAFCLFLLFYSGALFAIWRSYPRVPATPPARAATEARLRVHARANPLQINIGSGGAYESKTFVGLNRVAHTFSASIKNGGSEGFLSNCKFHLDIADQNGGAPRSYLWLDAFTLNASEERFVPIVQFDERPSTTNSTSPAPTAVIRLLIPVTGAFLDAGIGWPWQMPVGSYVFVLRATSKEADPFEILCRIWVDDAGKLHFEKA